jgi:hypothetical protein
LELPEFVLAGGASAVEPCPIELEALATVARFVTQALSLVSLVPGNVRGSGAVVATGPGLRRAVEGASWCRRRTGPNACLYER